MTRWLLALLTATVLLCAGFAAPGDVQAAEPSENAARIMAGGDVTVPFHTDGPEGDLPQEDASILDAEPSTLENAWDGAEFLVVHPALSPPLSRALASFASGTSRLPQPFIEGLQRPPRA